jgi:hypothetical protein
LIGRRSANPFGPVRAALVMTILACEVVFDYFLMADGAEFVLSGIVVTIAVLLQLKFAVRQDAPTPADLVVWVFNWLFLDLAPKIQLMSVPHMLVNTSSVSAERVLMTNLLCALFIVTFTLVYARLIRQPNNKPQQAKPANTVALPHPARPPNAARPSNAAGQSNAAGPASLPALGVALTVGLCVLLVAAGGHTLYANTDEALVLTPADLIVRKFLLFIPSATLLILLHDTNWSRHKPFFGRACVLILLILLVAVTENPLTEKRNGLGPIYLGMIFIAFEPTLKGMNRRLLLLLASMVLVFPAITVLTHNHSQIFTGVKIGAVMDTVKDHYFSTHYDAWANIYTSVEMVKQDGIAWGRQLLGGIFFWVPSSLWHGKPLASGIAIANYLIRNYAMWFTNLSAPLVAEGYLDFGTAGVALYGAGLAVIVHLLNRIARRESAWFGFAFATYAALFLMFALRGSLMIAFAYGTGAMLAFLTASACLSIGKRSMGERYYMANVHSHYEQRRSLLGL